LLEEKQTEAGNHFGEILMQTNLILSCSLLLVAGPLLSGLAAHSQQPSPGQIQAIVTAQMQKNKQELQQYSWKQKTDLDLKGEEKSSRVDFLRYDSQGQLVKTPLSVPPPPQQKSGRLVGKMKAKKIDEMKDYIERLMERVRRYTTFSGTDPQQIMQKATLTTGQDRFVIHIKDYVIPGDSVDISLDPTTRKIRQFKVVTSLDQDPVNVVAEFRELPDGPTYMSQATVDSPKKELQIRVTSYDYMKAPSS
jgi:hypothetical protein